MPIINLSNLQQFTAVNFSSDPGAIGGPVVIPQCAEISLLWSLVDGKTAHVVLHGRYVGAFAGTVAQCNGILTGLAAGAQWTALAAFLSSTTTLAAVTIRDLNVPNKPLIQSSNAGSPGTSASPAMPSEVAAVITHRTGQAGRAFRGRSYIPGWATNSIGAGDVILAAAVTALQNWANTIPTTLTAQSYTFCIGQKARAAYTGSTGVAHPARLATTVDITSQTVRDNHWDTQRRRGFK